MGWVEIMNAEGRRFSAHLIIHTVAVSASITSAVFATAPVLGVAGDTAMLTTLTVAMTMMLGHLFGKEITHKGAFSVGAVAVGWTVGTSLAKVGLSLFPVAGSAINATITFGLHEAIGWGLFLIFEAGLDPTKITHEELISKFLEGMNVAKE
jgi:uncharacterized protein (DUF697 family)